MKNKAINGWKGILAMVIVLGHFGHNASTMLSNYMAVECFAVISGFLLALSISNKSEYSISDILKRRLSKIYPIYILGIILMLILWIFDENLKNEISVSLGGLISELLMHQCSRIMPYQLINGQDWYISAYLISTILILFFHKVISNNLIKNGLRVIPIVLYCSYILNHGYINTFDNFYNVLNGGCITVLACMTIGMFAFDISEMIKKMVRSDFQIQINVIEIVSAVILMKCVYSSVYTWEVFDVIVIFSILIISSTIGVGIVSNVLSAKLFQLLGNMSTHIYLLHLFVGYFVRDYICKYISVNNDLQYNIMLCVIVILFSGIVYWGIQAKIHIVLYNFMKKYYFRLYILIAPTVVFIIEGVNIWAEDAGEYMNYARGMQVSLQGNNGYFAAIPIGTAVIWNKLLSRVGISWFGFSTLVAYIITMLCIIAISKSLKKWMNNKSVIIFLTPLLMMIAHPSVSALTNIAHLGYVPLLVYTILVVMNDCQLEKMKEVPTAVIACLVLSATSKPSLIVLLLMVLVLFTNIRKNRIALVGLLCSIGLIIYQLNALVSANSGLVIDGLTSVMKLMLAAIESVGCSLLFVFTFYIENVGKSLIYVGFILGLFICLLPLILFKKYKKKDAFVGGLLLVIVMMIVEVQYLYIDYTQNINNVLMICVHNCFRKYKLQYQLISVLPILLLFWYGVILVANSIRRIIPEKRNILNAMISIIIIGSINGLCTSIYAGSFQTVNPLKSNNAEYTTSGIYLYPPYNDWDWGYTNCAESWWSTSCTYSKYTLKPTDIGGQFYGLNETELPQAINEGKIYLVLSDATGGRINVHNWWNYFLHPDREIEVVLTFGDGEIKIKFSKITTDGVRYAMMNYDAELLNKLLAYDGNIFLASDGSQISDYNYLNVVLCYR